MKTFFYSVLVKIYTFVKQYEHTWYDEVMFKEEKLRVIKDFITGSEKIHDLMRIFEIVEGKR